MTTEIYDNAPVQVAELDRVHRESAALGQQGEIATWQAATRLGLWFFVNRGTVEAPRPYAVQPPGMGPLVCIYSSRDRAADAARELGQEDVVVFAIPTGAALEYLASLGERGVAGIVLDHPRIGLWTPIGNLPRFTAWLVPQTVIRRADPSDDAAE